MSDVAIKIRRKRSNEIIAAHDAAGLEPFFSPTARVIAGDGTLIEGRAAILAAFTTQFAEPTFVAFLRTPLSVSTDQDGSRASESGKWTGTWHEDNEERTLQGTYLAAWCQQDGVWVIESELFITLTQKLRALRAR